MRTIFCLFLGSHPEGITRTTYEKIAKPLNLEGLSLFLDTSAHFVPDLLGKYHPILSNPTMKNWLSGLV